MQRRQNTVITVLALVSASAILFLANRQRRSVQAAKAFIGQQEKSGNTGFQSEEMERLMREVGWRYGDAWCVYFVKLMWFMTAPEWLKPKIKKAISGNSQQTWDNAQRDPAFVTSRLPRPGDIAIWQNMRNGQGLSNGHAGIVKRVNVNNFVSIEGNTTKEGISSEGIEVAERVRGYDFDIQNGLRLKGFVRFT